MYNHVFHNAVTINWNNILLRENNISQSKNDIYRKAETIYLDCSQSPIFSIVESNGPPSWSLDVSKTGHYQLQVHKNPMKYL